MRVAKLSEEVYQCLKPIEELLNRACMDDEEFRKVLDKVLKILEKLYNEKETILHISKIAKLLGEICEKKRIIRHEKHVTAIYFAATLTRIVLGLGEERSK